MTTPSDARAAIISTDADLHAFWTALMGPLGFGRRSLWLAVFDANGRPVPLLQPVDDIPLEPRRFLPQWQHFCRTTLEMTAAASAAVLYTRPGSDPMNDRDRRWARAIRASADGSARLWPTHFANDEHLTVFAPDDLIEA